MTTYWKASASTVDWKMMDMDSAGLNFIVCGRTKDTEHTKTTSSYATFLQSMTQGLNLNFFITI